MIEYFAFGSNLLPAQLLARCPGARLLGPAVLRDWRLGFAGTSASRGGGGVATILRAPGARVPGFLYVLPFRDVDRLDRFEGHPRFYAREWVTVRRGRCGRGRPVVAFTYRLDRPPRAPHPEYLGLLRRAYRLHRFDRAALRGAVNACPRWSSRRPPGLLTLTAQDLMMGPR